MFGNEVERKLSRYKRWLDIREKNREGNDVLNFELE